MPIVTTLHTVLPAPTPAQHNVMGKIIARSTKLVVMAEKGRELLRSVHDVPPQKIEVIPHGIPDFPFLETHHAKTKFGFSGKTVILTFGLLSPSKGIETVIDAMPAIVESCPNAVYVILGATHPNLIRHQGEAYREGLNARVRELGMEDHVVFFNQFVDQATLLDFISMCDVYATPYLNEAQMTSGTLAYSFGLGKAVVSTPYWHARELLDDGRGILVPFGDAKAIGSEIAALLSNDVRRHAMRKRAYAASRSMTWAQTAKRYLATFELSRETSRSEAAPAGQGDFWSESAAFPELRIGHFLSMCDSTGLLQHAIHSIPDRAHGYCVDDNARALLLSSSLATFGEAQLSEPLTVRFAAFIQHAWNPDTHRFRNFMSYDRRWLEAQGSEDSHGRTLWALGECARSDADPSRRKWAVALFKTALPAVEHFRSPRAWAFTLLGLDAYCAVVVGDLTASRLRELLADRLVSAFHATETKDWLWFEDVLAYDNARLPQALLLTGAALKRPAAGQGWPHVPALAHGAADHTGRIFQTRRHRKLRRRAQSPTSVRPAARRSSGGDFSLPCGMARERQRRSGRPEQCAHSIGSWAATTSRHRLSIQPPGVAWTGCIAIVRTRTRAQSWRCPIFSALPRCVSLHALVWQHHPPSSRTSWLSAPEPAQARNERSKEPLCLNPCS